MPINPQNDRVAVVVDGYSTASYLAPAFLAHGVRCVHVSSGEQRVPALRATHSPEFYLAELSGDIDRIVEGIGSRQVEHVLPGLDSGSELATALAVRLGVHTRNDESLARARRDKAAMLGVLRAAGLPVRAHREATSVDEAVSWSVHNGRWPVVVKPTGSAGTDGVRICDTPQEVAVSAEAVLAGENIFGVANDRVLVEDFLPGQEYMVNTVSVDGWHRTVEVWRTMKRRQERANVYDYFELVDPRRGDGERVTAAATAVLDALGFRWGPAHLELIDAPHGVELVEVSPRFHGGVDLSATTAALGTNQVAETVRALLSPEHYRTTNPQAAPVDTACTTVVLLSPRSGVLTGTPDWDALRELKTFHSMRVRWSHGQEVRRTDDMFTSAGNVYLVGEASQVEADRELARRWAEVELARAITAS